MGWDTISPVLIDIENDMGERNDLSNQHTEVTDQLTKEFHAWFDELSRPLVYPLFHWRKFMYH